MNHFSFIIETIAETAEVIPSEKLLMTPQFCCFSGLGTAQEPKHAFLLCGCVWLPVELVSSYLLMM